MEQRQAAHDTQWSPSDAEAEYTRLLARIAECAAHGDADEEARLRNRAQVLLWQLTPAGSPAPGAEAPPAGELRGSR